MNYLTLLSTARREVVFSTLLMRNHSRSWPGFSMGGEYKLTGE